MLEGIRVLDLSHVVAGPYATMYMAMMGAEVIKIENPKVHGDVNRETGPFKNGVSVRFCTLNHNKKSIALDLSTEDGKAIFLELVKTADVVIENFKPGVMDKLGIGYEVIKARNPKIVYGSISGFGTYGPYCDLPAYDIVAQSMSGIMWLSGAEGEPPIKIGTSIGDMIAGINLFGGVLAALRRAEQTGQGDFVEVSLVDSLISALQMDYINYLFNGEVPAREGNHYREWSPCGVYRAKDGYYGIGVGSEEIFQRLVVSVLNRPDLAVDPRFSSHAERVKNRKEFDVYLNEWAEKRSVEEVFRTLRESRIPSAPVKTIADIVQDRHIAGARNMFPHYYQPDAGEIRIVNTPVRFHAAKEPGLGAAPELGENSREILRDILNLSETDIEHLVKSGTIIDGKRENIEICRKR